MTDKERIAELEDALKFALELLDTFSKDEMGDTPGTIAHHMPSLKGDAR